MGMCESKNLLTKPQSTTKASQSEQDKKMKVEKIVRGLQTQIKTFEDKQKKLQFKIDAIKKQAKQLLQNDKKEEAKKMLQKATNYKKQSSALAIRRKVIQSKKKQLQQADMNIQTINALSGAQQHIKDSEEYNQKLQDLMQKSKIHRQQQDQINNKFNTIVQEEEDDQEIDDMMAELNKQIKRQKKAKVQQKNTYTRTEQNNNVNIESKDQLLKMIEKL